MRPFAHHDSLTGTITEAPARKPRRDKFSRARAKKWFKRHWPGLPIFGYDGKHTFHIDPRMLEPPFNDGKHFRRYSMRFGRFLFTTHPGGIVPRIIP